jgi:hypothetical protein
MNENRFHRTVDKLLEMNSHLWKALTLHGVKEDSKLVLDFFFYAKQNESAELLRAFLLQDTDYDVYIERSGPFFRRRWCIKGSTKAKPVSKAILDDWVIWMARVGADQDCEFDGWGTEVA